MPIRNFLLLALTTLGGIGAFGCWVLIQADSAITPQQGPTVILILVGCIALFGGASFISAAASTSGQGAIVRVRRTLFLMGVSGAIAVLFFAIVSRGRIFLFGPVPTVLLAVFILVALPRDWGQRSGGTSSNSSMLPLVQRIGQEAVVIHRHAVGISGNATHYSCVDPLRPPDISGVANVSATRLQHES
jgi:hypothetical protein